MVRNLVGVQGPFPVSERIAERGLYLPSGLALTGDQLEHVCAAMHDAVRDGPPCA
jgi:dTDP-4-amino-4,6-dideoxygalactose transaminase